MNVAFESLTAGELLALVDAKDAELTKLRAELESLRPLADLGAKWPADMHRIAEAVAGEPVRFGSEPSNYGNILGAIDNLRYDLAEAERRVAVMREALRAADAEADGLRQDLIAKKLSVAEVIYRDRMRIHAHKDAREALRAAEEVKP